MSAAADQVRISELEEKIRAHQAETSAKLQKLEDILLSSTASEENKGDGIVTKRLRDIWSGVSSHGLSKVFSPATGGGSRLERVGWLAVTVAAALVMALLIQQTWREYASGETATSVNLQHVDDWREFWPEITICNFQQWDTEKVLRDASTSDDLLLQGMSDFINDDIKKSTWRVIQTGDHGEILATYSSEFAEKYRLDVENFTFGCGNMVSYGEPVIVNCRNATETFLVPDLGACYRYQMTEIQKRSGRNGGISIGLSFKEVAGNRLRMYDSKVRILIGHPRNVDFKGSLNKVIQVKKGSFKKVNITPKKLVRPAGQGCNTYEDIKGLYDRVGEVPHPLNCWKGCKNLCSLIVTNCSRYPGFQEDEACLDDDSIRETANVAFRDDEELNNEFWKCSDRNDCRNIPNMCTTVSYDVVSEDLGESKTQMSSIVERFKVDFAVDQNDNRVWTGLKEALDSRNKSRFEAMADEVSFVHVELQNSGSIRVETVHLLYTRTTFLTNLGGSMGLLMGISAITVVEMVYCAFLTLKLLLQVASNRFNATENGLHSQSSGGKFVG